MFQKLFWKVLNYFQSPNEKKLYLSPHFKNENLIISADKDILKEVIENLLSNAIKFTKTGGVAIKVEENIYDDKILLDIKFIDTGIGISKEHQQVIFEEFRQVSEGFESKI